jgi:hypothetical protein
MEIEMVLGVAQECQAVEEEMQILSHVQRLKQVVVDMELAVAEGVGVIDD